MATQSFRHLHSPSPKRRRRAARFSGLRISQLEDRTAPALFNVQTPQAFTGLNNNGCVAVADLDHDGKKDDAVFTNFGTDHGGGAGQNIIVLYQRDDGGFNRAQHDTLGRNVAFVAIADINGDTWDDVVVVNANQENVGGFTVFKNDGGNLIRQGTQYSTFGNNSAWVGLADVTGDNVLDVIVCSFGAANAARDNVIGNNITIFQGAADGQGKGNFIYANTPLTTLTGGLPFVPTALAVADFDVDGVMDIAACVPGVPPDFGLPQVNGSVYAFRGTGNGTFASPNIVDTGGALPVNIQAGLINADNRPDLVVSNAGDPQANPEFNNDSVGVLMNISSAENVAFGVPNSLTDNTYGTFATAIHDFNMDGKADIAAINYGSQFGSPAAFVSLYIGNGAGSFSNGSPGSYDTLTNFGGGQYLAVGNFDANSSPDLIVAHATNRVGVMLNTTVTGPTVTINQGAGQADPTSAGSIVFDVVFSEGVTGFTESDISFAGSTVGGTLQATVTPVSTTAYTVTVTGMSGSGTVRASIPAGAATAISGGAGTQASTSSDNQVTFDAVAPTVTINQAAGQVDPTTTGPIQFTAVFSESVTGFTASDVSFAGSTVGGTLQATVSGSGTTYTVSVTGMAGNGTVVATIPAGAATDGAGNNSDGSTSTDNSVTFGTPTAPTVTINQGSGQADPTNAAAIAFDVVFSEGVTGFIGSDVSFAGSTVGGTLQATVTPVSASVYTVSVTGMTGNGVVVASIPAGVATSIAGGLGNVASTSSDNQVTFDGTGPTATINQAAGQADPTATGPIQFTVVFSESVTGFTGSDVSFAGSTVGGTLQASVSGSGTTYTVSVTGMSGAGTVVASVPAGAATDAAGNPTAAATSTDNTVTFDGAAPTVTINQGSTQSDPTNVSAIKFDVVFSEPVSGFTASDVSLAGSTVGGTLSATVTGSLGTYEVTVTGMTTNGSVVASIPAGVAVDPVGNPNAASSSSDNSVQFVNNGVIGFKQAVYTAAENTGTNTITITLSRTGQTDGAVSIDFATADGTARTTGSAQRGLADYVPINGTISWADGEGGDKSFEIQVQPDELNEGKELINLSLTNPQGSPGLEITSAVVAIAPSDGQGPGKYMDQDGDRFNITLAGRVGSLVWFRSDADGDGRGPIELIELTDTLPDPLLPKAVLTIGVPIKSVTSVDKGTVAVGAITGPGLAAIRARKANLNMEGINLNGYLRNLVIGNVLNGADITTQATSNPLQKTRINALAIADGTSINVGAALVGLTATRIGVGSITAPSAGTIWVRGQPLAKPAVIGDMASDITLTGDGLVAGQRALALLRVAGSIPSGVDITAPNIGRIFVRRDFGGDISISGDGVVPPMRALGTLRVVGAVTGSDVLVNGNVGNVVVGAFRDSRLFAGYTGPDDGTGSFNTPAIVSVFRSLGKVDGFQNSRVIATIVSLASITNLDSTNATPFGFYADVGFGSIKVIGPIPFAYDPSILAPQGVGDFEVMIV